MRKASILSLAAATGLTALVMSNSGHAETSLDMIEDPPLGLPPVPVPEDNPVTPAKVELGEKLFNDTRLSLTGDISCATCHDAGKAFTDGPLTVSKGINDLEGTRNAPTVVNAAYMELQFWDGREPDLERQSHGPFINAVEMGMADHPAVVQAVRDAGDYDPLFEAAFGVDLDDVTIEHIGKAIASFERTQIAADSPWDRWHFGGEEAAVSDAVKRGFDVFVNDGRCVSCHTVNETYALFTDSRFHNLNVSFEKISGSVATLTDSFRGAPVEAQQLDSLVLADADISELGRFAVTRHMTDVGAFKTPTLRNVAMTAPYMHDGSIATLEEVVTFYNLGGRLNEEDPINSFQSGGIRPLDLTEQQQADLVAFLEALTSPEFVEAAATDGTIDEGGAK
ncbi:cytochrome-c peroxidase [Pacificimonas flava]|uniref:Cytochrome-c peroxidase n=2 Tax=Pacificimonas TaxID=1960290 RepID=A0A219B1D6_9SPHN|nr:MULTISPECIES: cytochrome c peroxidase [Pacificimonas]MBZ6380043.1 c-type cytochrome [Pacificimonas aurantium]OWV32014.1 cytochrome-c peroxidase [Pacificimonas flava]